MYRIPVPKRRKQALAKLQRGWYCVYCNATENLCMDHLYPQCLGGTDDLRNLVLACAKCNNTKAQHTPADLNALGLSQMAETVTNYRSERLLWTIADIDDRLKIELEGTEPAFNKYERFVEMPPFGKLLNETLIAKGITKHRLRTDLQLAGWTLDRWLTGEHEPSIEYMDRLCEYIGIDDTGRHRFVDALQPIAKTPEWSAFKRELYRHRLTLQQASHKVGYASGYLTGYHTGKGLSYQASVKVRTGLDTVDTGLYPLLLQAIQSTLTREPLIAPQKRRFIYADSPEWYAFYKRIHANFLNCAYITKKAELTHGYLTNVRYKGSIPKKTTLHRLKKVMDLYDDELYPLFEKAIAETRRRRHHGV